MDLCRGPTVITTDGAVVDLGDAYLRFSRYEPAHLLTRAAGASSIKRGDTITVDDNRFVVVGARPDREPGTTRIEIERQAREGDIPDILNRSDVRDAIAILRAFAPPDYWAEVFRGL